MAQQTTIKQFLYVIIKYIRMYLVLVMELGNVSKIITDKLKTKNGVKNTPHQSFTFTSIINYLARFLMSPCRPFALLQQKNTKFFF